MKKSQRGEVVSSMVWAYIDKITTNGLSVIISIILARMIVPEHYGVIGLASIFIVLMDLFVEPGMTSALIQKKDSDEKDFSTILIFHFCLGIVLYAFLFFAAPFISRLYAEPILTVVIRVLALKLVFGGINSVIIAYVQKHMLFKKYCLVSFVGTFGGALLAIAIAYADGGIWALVAYNLVNPFFNVILSIIVLKWLPPIGFSFTRFKQMYSFGWKMLATKFVDQACVEISQMIIGKRYSITDLAFYNKGKTYPQLLVNNANQALANVLFPVFSRVQDDQEDLRMKLRSTVRTVSFVMFPLVIGLAACSENFIVALLTDKWVAAIPYLRWICVYYLWIPFSNVILQGLKALGRSDVILKMEGFKQVCNIVVMIIALIIIDSPLAIAISVAIGGMISFCMEIIVSIKVLGYKGSELINDVVPSFLLAIIMGVIVYSFNNFNFPFEMLFIIFPSLHNRK